MFAVASEACGFAPSALALNLARSVQRVRVALLLTSSLAIIAHDVPGEARAFACWGASLGIALAVGPIVGGAITDFFGWRWVFLVNLPLSALLIGAALRTTAASRDPGGKGLDGPGIVTFSLGLGLLIWALIGGDGDGWTSISIVLRMVAAVLLLTVGGLHLGRVAPGAADGRSRTVPAPHLRRRRVRDNWLRGPAHRWVVGHLY